MGKERKRGADRGMEADGWKMDCECDGHLFTSLHHHCSCLFWMHSNARMLRRHHHPSTQQTITGSKFSLSITWRGSTARGYLNKHWLTGGRSERGSVHRAPSSRWTEDQLRFDFRVVWVNMIADLRPVTLLSHVICPCLFLFSHYTWAGLDGNKNHFFEKNVYQVVSRIFLPVQIIV